jgi:hypothetical protein
VTPLVLDMAFGIACGALALLAVKAGGAIRAKFSR